MKPNNYVKSRRAYAGIESLRAEKRRKWLITAAVIILAGCVIAIRLVQVGGVR